MSKELMPEKLKKFLKGLSPRDKEQAWRFFDEDPSALERMITMIGDKYPVNENFVLTHHTKYDKMIA